MYPISKLLFKIYRCPSCDEFVIKPGNLERHFTNCCENVKYEYPKTEYQLREILFDHVDSFGILLTDNRKLSENMPIFGSMCVEAENFSDTETTTWIGKHIEISVSSSSNWKQEPFSSAILILVTWYHISLTLCRIWLRKVKLKWKWTSFKMKPQRRVDLHVSWIHSVNIVDTVFVLKHKMTIPKTAPHSF